MTYEELWTKARQAGNEAVRKLTPVPMIVEEHENMLDDTSPVRKSWFVEDGVCGFAWVKIRPANSPFAKFAKLQPRTGEYLQPDKDSYSGGLTIWVIVGNQSMQKKEAYAEAFAKVLRDNGINAYAESRLD